MNLKKNILSFLGLLNDRQRSSSRPSPVSSRIRTSQKSDTPPYLVMDNALLAGKSALITGAGRNIGRSIALEMARQGANIFFTEINEERCRKVERELKKYDVRSRGFVSDISKTDDIDALYSSLAQEKICVDILVNNVGIQPVKDDMENFDIREWHKTFDTNVMGPVYLTRHIVEMMKTNNVQGSILFITSIHQFVPGKYFSYSGTKGGLGMIVKELSLNVASRGIRVNGIAPGWVLEDEQGMPFDFKFAPLHGTSINPCYIGRAAVFLASDYFSRFTTGSVITVDGGLSLFHYQMVDDLEER